MNNISTVTLGDLLEFQRGYDLPKSQFINGNIPVISSNGILGFHNEVKVKAPGITIGRSGTVGLPHFIEQDFFPHNTSLFVKDFKDNDPKYLFYLLKNLKLNDRKSGSGVPTMNRNHLHPLKIKAYKELIDQKKTALVLSSIDKKIELNNRINTELEAMAKTLYDYWFVQFDFPNPSTNLEQAGKPYKSSGGKMVFNEALKREVPEGWEAKALVDWIHSDKTGDWGKDSLQGNYTEQVSCIRGADINGLNGKGNIKSPTRFILNKNKHKLLETMDLIIEISGGSPTQSTGRLAFLIEETLSRFNNPLICSNFCKAIRLQDNVYFFNFIYQWDQLYQNGILFGWEGKTSGIKNLLFDSFVNNYQTVYPNRIIVENFSKFVQPLQSKKQKLLLENQQLTQLRDWLLPMLMNGQITVK